MKACKKKANQIWPGNKSENVKLKIGYHAGWKDALEWAKSQQEMDHGANGYVIDPEIIEEELEQ